MLKRVKKLLRRLVIKDMVFVINTQLPNPIETEEDQIALNKEVMRILHQIEYYCCDIFDDLSSVLKISEAVEHGCLEPIYVWGNLRVLKIQILFS